MKPSSFIDALPRGFRIVLADVGSAGGLPPRWAAVRPAVSALLFEPREGGETRREGPDTVFPFGLGPAQRRETLHVTAMANMSSTLEPDAEEFERYSKKPGHARVENALPIEVQPLDALAERESLRIDALKVDTQGSERGILEGARACLTRSAVIAEVEVSFFQRYRGQALFCDIAAFMAECGYELVDLYRLKRYRWANDSGIANLSLGGGQRAGRLAYGDAVFFLGESALRQRLENADAEEAERIALCATMVLLIYGKADMAARVWDLARSFVREPWRERMSTRFSRLGRRPTGSGVLHHVFDYLARHV